MDGRVPSDPAVPAFRPAASLPIAAPEPNLRRDLAACTGDGLTYSYMVGVGETYLAAFVLALGMQEVTSGLVTAIPPLVGGVVQLVATAGVNRLGSPRKWVMICASTQAASLVPLVVGAIVGSMPPWLVFLCASLYWAAALAAGGVWNTWVGMLFPPRIRARYFGRRSRACQILTLAGLLSGGFLLSTGERSGVPLAGFAACFGLASMARLSSLFFLARQADPPSDGFEHKRVSVLAVLRRAGHATDAKLIVFMVSLQAATMVAAPYFNPFMLDELGFDKATYTTMIAASFLAKSLALPLHARYAERFGARRLLMLSSVGVSVLAAVWMVDDSPAWILPTQILAGALWGGYELATFLLLLETIPAEERTSVMGGYYLLNGLAAVTGSLIGAWLLGPEQAFEGYMLLFAISTFLRLATLPLAFRVTADTRKTVPLAADPIAVRPSAGSIAAPDLAGIEGKERER